MKKILCIILCFACFLLMTGGCNGNKRTAQKQLFESIAVPNIQGVKEALKKDKSILNKRVTLRVRLKPLEFAIREIESEKIQLEICTELLKSGAQVNRRGIDGDTDLMAALRLNRWDLAKKLIQYGADVNKGNSYNKTPLSIVIGSLSMKDHEKEKEMIQALLEAGAEPDSGLLLKEGGGGEYGINYYYAPYILDMLEKYQATKGIPESIRAIIKGENLKVQKMVKSGQVKKSDRKKLLRFSAAYGNVQTLKVMKQEGYDLETKDYDKVGLIHIAAMCNQPEVLRYLMEQGLDGRAKIDFFEVDAADYAILGNKSKNLELLKERYKKDYTKKHQENCDVWSFINNFGNETALKLLESAGHRLNDEELHYSYRDCTDKQYQYLVKIKDSIYVKNEGDSLLSIMAYKEDTRYFYDLCKRGLRANEEQLVNLIAYGGGNIVRKVIKNNLTQGKIEKEVLLQKAIVTGDFVTIKYLVENGADINKYVKREVEDDYSCTAIQLAYASGSRKIAEYLKEKGGDETKKDSQGNNCREIAKKAKAVWNY